MQHTYCRHSTRAALQGHVRQPVGRSRKVVVRSTASERVENEQAAAAETKQNDKVKDKAEAPKADTNQEPARAVTAQGGDLSEFYGPNRGTWLPDYDPPAWLDGTMAGDHGCDFLGVCEDPRTIDQFRRGEVINSRFAMLGATGMIVPEILQANGADIKGAVWFETGAAMLNGGKLNYFGAEVPITLQGVIISNAALVFVAEWFRWQEFAPGWEPDCADTLYPGGPFDPLGLADDPDEFKKLKVNEVRNGRLAKTAFLGMVWQAYITREGPWKNLQDFLSDPVHNNIFTRWPSDPSTMTL